MPLTHKALALLTLIVFSTATHATQTPAESSVASLINDLQSGGHIIYMRHGPTARDQKDSLDRDFDDCSTQRNLSAAGRDTAAAIGRAVKRLEIPIGNVYSSPYCRCIDTAQLVFKRFSVEPDLQFSMSKNKQESQLLGERLKAMMLKAPVGTNNTVFVGHTSNLREGLGVWPKPEGVWNVFKNTGAEVVYKGTIKPDDWSND